eukprot:4493040-Amphidinium_carterae.1
MGVEGVTTLSTPLVVRLRAVAVATEASIHLILMEEAIAEIKVTGNHETGVETEATKVGMMPDHIKLHNPRLRPWISTNVLSRSWKL